MGITPETPPTIAQLHEQVNAAREAVNKNGVESNRARWQLEQLKDSVDRLPEQARGELKGGVTDLLDALRGQLSSEQVRTNLDALSLRFNELKAQGRWYREPGQLVGETIGKGVGYGAEWTARAAANAALNVIRAPVNEVVYQAQNGWEWMRFMGIFGTFALPLWLCPKIMKWSKGKKWPSKFLTFIGAATFAGLVLNRSLASTAAAEQRMQEWKGQRAAEHEAPRAADARRPEQGSGGTGAPVTRTVRSGGVAVASARATQPTNRPPVRLPAENPSEPQRRQEVVPQGAVAQSAPVETQPVSDAASRSGEAKANTSETKTERKPPIDFFKFSMTFLGKQTDIPLQKIEKTTDHAAAFRILVGDKAFEIQDIDADKVTSVTRKDGVVDLSLLNGMKHVFIRDGELTGIIGALQRATDKNPLPAEGLDVYYYNRFDYAKGGMGEKGMKKIKFKLIPPEAKK